MKIGRLLGSNRGTRNLLRRARTVFSRFGLTPQKMTAMLGRYVDITEEYGCEPTFPITAVTLRRHPRVIRDLSERGVEFAIHGYVHVDHRPLSLDRQLSHFRKAIGVFEECEIPFAGFRAPYLRSNPETLEALSELGLAYDSSQVIQWNTVDRSRFNGGAWSEYAGLLDYYGTQDADTSLGLPRFKNGLMVIPVSMPDDEAMVGRLGIRDEDEIAGIWKEILYATHRRGELFTVQLHHERVRKCEKGLRTLLGEARALDPPVWIATLGQIAQWWKDRRAFSLEASRLDDRRWSVRANCGERATILVRGCATDVPTTQWPGAYGRVGSRDFVVESPVCPSVGVAPDSSQEAIRFLESEGYLVEVSDAPAEHSLYLDGLAGFGESDEKRLSDTIEQSDAGLVRFWRWPNGTQSALAVTGDIDSMTLIDFFLRVLEVWRNRIAR